MHRPLACAATLGVLLLAACQRGDRKTSSYAADQGKSWCDEVPRPANAALPAVDVGSAWFSVYQAAPGVFAIVEPRQFQEAISYLIVGDTSALLFDSGIGMVRIKPVVDRLTRVPVAVLNSHTHFDHVGGNWEFAEVLGLDTEYTRANERGLPHAALKGEAASEALCKPIPDGVDTAQLQTRPWTVTRRVADGTVLDLGGRRIEILAAPGHTPDAIALLDRAHGLLFTGDSYYDGTIWLFVPETDLDAYEHSLARLVELGDATRTLLPAHNTASVPAGRLATVLAALRTMRAGGGVVTPQEDARILVRVGDVQFMTSKAVLAGRARAKAGGSGLTPAR
ncbi:MAG: MBL fold metallo-hydrolase [Gemmatimonadetes bacterium]|nr:MBL fold metallo-hydrolase [Gemmatimonadota bacterium]